MKIAVLSGKGGAGKTFIAVNLVLAAQGGTYVDCDVEEPNGRLFLKPRDTSCAVVYRMIPSFDKQACTACHACVEFCRFNALMLIETPFLFDEICHSCTGCSLVCPEHAITMSPKRTGEVEIGMTENIHVVTGIMDQGEVSAVPVIKAAKEKAEQIGDDLVVIDCPPGSACSVMESVKDVDFCIIVAEPTSFGFHNFKMVYELVTLLNKPNCVVVNKEYIPYEPLEEFFRQNDICIALRIPYSHEFARLGAKGENAGAYCTQLNERFQKLLDTINRKATQ